MKNLITHNYSLVFISVTLLSGSVSCESNEGGKNCEYESFTDEFHIDYINKTNDTNYRIRFVNLKNTEFTIELNESFVDASMNDFNDNLMHDKKQIYIIKGELITSGSCDPQKIQEIELKN